MDDEPVTEAEEFWTVEITLSSEGDRDRVFAAVERLLHDMGEIGTISSHKWEPL